jgi:hypothetical protein
MSFQSYSILTLFLSLGTSLFAAPLPIAKEDPNSFEKKSHLTKEDLDRIPFPNPANIDKEAKDRDRKNSLNVALYLPRTRFKEGDSIPAYFVVKNLAHDSAYLDLRLDFFHSPPRIVNSGWVKLFNLTQKKEVPLLDQRIYECGGSPKVKIQEQGYYCVKVDLSCGPLGKLAAGAYECTWGYAQWRSNTVRFTVIRNTGEWSKEIPKAKYPHLRVLSIEEDVGDGIRRISEDDEPRIWNQTCVHPFTDSAFGAALGTGIGGKYYPDLRAIPNRDDLIHITGEWTFKKSRDRFKVTIQSNDPEKPVQFRELPKLYLQIESEGNPESPLHEEVLQERLRGAGDIETPLIFEVRLPQNWRENGGLKGKGRVAILVSSQEIEFPSDIQLDTRKEEQSQTDRLWSGLLRTTFTEVETPSSVKK